MKNFFFIIAILLSLGGAYFAYDNTNKLKAAQAETVETAQMKNIILANLSKAGEDLNDVKGELKNTNIAISDATASTDTAKSNEVALQRTLTKQRESLLSIKEQIAGHNELLEQVELALLDIEVESIEDIPTKVEDLQKSLIDKEAELDDVSLINEKLSEKITKDTESKNSANERLSKIKSNISSNAMTATVTSVNTEWGFVVVNRGAANSPITEETELLVQRSGRYVGKLKVATLESNQAICDIDLKNFKGGSLPRPGDRVILRDPFER